MSENNWGMVGCGDTIVTVRGASVHVKALTLKQRMDLGERFSNIEVKVESIDVLFNGLAEVVTKIEFPDDSPMAKWNDKPVKEVLENITDTSVILDLIGEIVDANKLKEAQEKNS
jgi:uncharacterized protein (DUF111 family)